ncbi:MAG TPA: substrate-binding domain-containing protein [Treponemataceae bacterium]|jgi:LacI family transcriptional regulator|nr:substrate-binding domain-containing protein [Treponemataceae bacterium]
MPAVSIRDVASRASLSCETILEVLTTPSSLEPEVVRFVMQTIRDSGYLDTFDRWRTCAHTASIAVVTPTFTSASGIEAFRGIDRAMSALGLNVTINAFPTRFSPAYREDTLRALLGNPGVDVAIAMNIKPSEDVVQSWRAARKPLVLLQSSIPGAQSVTLDNQKGMSIGVSYLARSGRRSIALMNGPTGGAEPGSVPAERLIGYLTALQRCGIPFDESLVFETPDYDSASGLRGFEYFQARGRLPDAVFCASGDMTAIGFIKAAREKGVSVPDDLAVMGYDDLPISSFLSPALTTIRQRLIIAGAGALVLALESQVNGPGESLVIVPELVVRETA